MNDIEIEEFIKNLTAECKDGNYIFRGTPEIYSKKRGGNGISSTLYRKHDFWDEHFKPIDVEKEIVEEIKGQLKKLYGKSTNIEILTDLRHYGEKVTLIDFTRNICTALFFASNGTPEKSGELIILKISEILQINDINYENPTFGFIEPAQTETSQNRAMSQNSIFVHAPDGFIPKDSCIIKTLNAKYKKDILNYLKERYGINQYSIYNDLIGFIDNRKTYDSGNRVEFYKGLSHDKNENYEGAIKFYGKAIELRPNFVAAYINRSVTKCRMEDYKGAIEDSDIAIELNPNVAEAYMNRGNSKREMEDYKGAIEDHDIAIELNPNLAGSYTNRGNSKYGMRDYEGAIADHDKAIELRPNFAGAYGNRGISKDGMKDYRGAIRDYNKAIELDPNLVNAYMNRGSSRSKMGDFEGAIEDDCREIKLRPNYATAYINRGSSKQILGDYKGAIKDCEKAIKLRPNYVNAYICRGGIKQDMGDYEGAIKDLEKVIELKPEYEEESRQLIEDLRKDLKAIEDSTTT